MPLVFIPIVIFPFVFSKLIFLQVLIGLTFPAYLALAWVEPKYRPRSSMLYLSIIAYFVALGLSVLFSVDILRSWWGNQERMNGLFTLLHFLAWLTMATGMLKTWPQWRKLLNFQVVLSVFMAIVAILQRPFPNLLMFPAGARVGGLLDNPIYMGAYQIFNVFFIALLWMKGASRNTKIWYGAAVIFDVVAFVFAESRGDLLGAGVGILVFAIAIALMSKSKNAKRAVIGFVVLCIASYGMLFALRDTSFVKNSSLARFTNLNATVDTRLIAWKIAWQGFLERPLTGWGLDDFHILFNQKYNPQSLRFGYYETWFDRSHNSVLDVLAMTGLFGFVTFAAIYISLFWLVIRAFRKGWIDTPVASILVSLPVAYFVQNLFVFDHPAAFSMSFLLFGLVIAATTAQFNEKPDDTLTASSTDASKMKVRQIPWIAFGILEIALVVVVWKTSIVPFEVSRISIESNSAFAAGDYQRAFDLAKQAAIPWTPYTEEQTFLQSRNLISLQDAGTLQKTPHWREWHDLIMALSKKQAMEHPRNTNPLFVYARFAESMSDVVPEDLPIADQEYKAAIALSPKRQQLYYSYAHFLIAHNRSDEATSYIQQTISFDDQIGESHWMMGLHQFYDLHDQMAGAKEMKLSQTLPYPYQLKDGREALALSLAYDLLNDKEGLQSVITMLPSLPQSDLAVYVQIARVMEHQGLIDNRNMILGALAHLDPTFLTRIQPLVNGSATSIDAALQMTQNLVTSTAPMPNATTTSTTSETGGTGPRR